MTLIYDLVDVPIAIVVIWVIVLLGVQRRGTERRAERYADELKRSNADLQQFAYVASHDLREPLRMVSSYLELLEKRYDGKVLDERAKEYIGFAVDGADRMKAMINDLLEYSRVDTQGKPFSEVDMGAVLSTSLKDLRSEIEKNEASITGDHLPTIMADETQMISLLENLIGNAIKFHGNEPPVVLVSYEEEKDELVFSIKDNGIGIDPGQKDRVFKMFHRLNDRERYEGTGIGLAMAKRSSNGTADASGSSRRSGKERQFYFTIPFFRGP